MPIDQIQDAKVKLGIVVLIIGATVSVTLWVSGWINRNELAHAAYTHEIELMEAKIDDCLMRWENTFDTKIDTRWKQLDMQIWANELQRANDNISVPPVTERSPTAPRYKQLSE